jgi:putative FmdB family regulatory protein
MPIYEFTCPKCQTTFDELLPASRRDDPMKCPCCGELHATRNLSAFAAPGASSGASGGGACGCGKPRKFS